MTIIYILVTAIIMMCFGYILGKNTQKNTPEQVLYKAADEIIQGVLPTLISNVASELAVASTNEVKNLIEKQYVARVYAITQIVSTLIGNDTLSESIFKASGIKEKEDVTSTSTES